MRPKLTLGVLGAVAIAAGLVLVRQQRVPQAPTRQDAIPAGETAPAEITPEKLRALGF